MIRDNFIALLDMLQYEGRIVESGVHRAVPQGEKSFINDLLKVVSLALSNTDGTATLKKRYFMNSGRIYQALLYRNLGELYLETDRISDAALTFLAYSADYPESPAAPEFHLTAINIYAEAGFNKQISWQTYLPSILLDKGYS